MMRRPDHVVTDPDDAPATHAVVNFVTYTHLMPQSEIPTLALTTRRNVRLTNRVERSRIGVVPEPVRIPDIQAARQTVRRLSRPIQTISPRNTC